MWSLCLVSDSVIEDVRPVGHCDPPLLLPGWGPGSVSVIFPPVFFLAPCFFPLFISPVLISAVVHFSFSGLSLLSL